MVVGTTTTYLSHVASLPSLLPICALPILGSYGGFSLPSPVPWIPMLVYYYHVPWDLNMLPLPICLTFPVVILLIPCLQHAPYTPSATYCPQPLPLITTVPQTTMPPPTLPGGSPHHHPPPATALTVPVSHAHSHFLPMPLPLLPSPPALLAVPCYPLP